MFMLVVLLLNLECVVCFDCVDIRFGCAVFQLALGCAMLIFAIVCLVFALDVDVECVLGIAYGLFDWFGVLLVLILMLLCLVLCFMFDLLVLMLCLRICYVAFAGVFVGLLLLVQIFGIVVDGCCLLVCLLECYFD